MSTTPHKASAEQWEQCASALIERLSRLEEGYDELAARFEALEREAAMNELRATSAEARPAAFDEAENDRRFEQAKAIIDQPTPTPASPLVEPSDIFPTEYADSDGDGIRIMMEPADETGRVCWVVRNSRHVNPCHEFPTPEAAYAAHKSASARQAVAATAPASSLVERVAGAIDNAPYDADRHQWDEARAAIRAQAAWLRDRGGYPWAWVAQILEKEAGR